MEQENGAKKHNLLIFLVFCLNEETENFFFIPKENIFAANKKTANAGNICSLIFFEKREVLCFLFSQKKK